MRKSLCRTLLIVTLALQSCLCLAQFGGGEENPALVEICGLDYQASIPATDRTWFYKNLDGTSKPAGQGQYPSIEWSSDGNANNDPNKIVYLRGSQITVDVKFLLHTGNSSTMNGYLTWTSAKFVSGSTTTNLSISGSGAISIAGQGATTVKTAIISGLPNTVQKGTLQLWGKITLTAPYEGRPSGAYVFGSATTPEGAASPLYLVDQTPTGLQTVPWTDLLGFTCGWAQGQTGLSNVRNQIAYGIYWGNWVYSATAPHYTTYINNNIETQTFDLKLCLQQVSNQPMDCQDFSNLFTLSAMSQGHSPSLVRIEIPGEYPAFKTNQTCPASLIPTIPSMYSYNNFNFHQIAMLDGIVDTTSAHWTDPSGTTYQLPPVGWSILPYWQVPIYNYFLDFRGLVFGAPGATNPQIAPSPEVTPIALQSIK